MFSPFFHCEILQQSDGLYGTGIMDEIFQVEFIPYIIRGFIAVMGQCDITNKDMNPIRVLCFGFCRELTILEG